jgi:hypothetical protein
MYISKNMRFIPHSFNSDLLSAYRSYGPGIRTMGPKKIPCVMRSNYWTINYYKPTTQGKKLY